MLKIERKIIYNLAAKLRVSRSCRRGAAGIGQQIGSGGESGAATPPDLTTTTTTGQQLFLMAKEIGAIQYTLLEVW